MENLSLLLFMSIAVPLGMSLAVCRGNARRLVLFFLFGMLAALFCGEMNGILTSALSFSPRSYSIQFAPIVEEITKALPVVFFAFVFKPERQTLLEISVAVGIGFAVLESAFVFVSSSASISLVTALLRAFGAGMMHGICTLAVGFGMSFVKSERKIFFAGTLALLAVACVYHSVYNNLVLAGYTWIGFLLPTVTLLPAIVVRIVKKNRIKKEENM